MNILFISVLVEEVTKKTEDYRKELDSRRDEIARATSPADAGIPVAPPDLRWTVPESNEVFCAAVKVATTIGSANGYGENYLGSHECTMRVLEGARAYATESGLDHRRIVAGLTDVATIFERNTSPFDGPGNCEDWWQHDARLAVILLPVVCNVYEVSKAHEEKLRLIREGIEREGAAPVQSRTVSSREAVASFKEKWEAKRANKGPVMLFDDRVVFECHPENPGPIWAVPLAEIQSPSRLLKWVSDLTSKTWCTSEMVRDFVGMVCSEKGWEIYSFDPTTNQEAQS